MTQRATVLAQQTAPPPVPDVPVEALVPTYAGPGSGSRFLPLLGMQVHYRDEGPAVAAGGAASLPLLLIHGTASSLHTWDGWVERLAGAPPGGGGRRVVRVDLPGFGLTGPAPDAKARGFYSNAAYVTFLLAFADAVLGPGSRFVIGGNSLGGELAWWVAVDAPARVAGLVLVDAVGYDDLPEEVPEGWGIAGGSGGGDDGKQQTKQKRAPVGLTMAGIRRTVESMYGDPARVTDGTVRRYFDMMRRQGNRGALRARLAVAWPPQRSDAIRQVAAPTLILWGGRDKLTVPSQAEKFHRDIHGSALVSFAALGHLPMEEDPATTAPHVLSFLRRHGL